jgi:eukaryotic-like serine/threonine-protein kinase
MVANICANERNNWRRLVDDSLPSSEAHELTRHLEHCESCREKFESLCAEASWWEDSTSTLRLIERESGLFQKSDRSPSIGSNAAKDGLGAKTGSEPKGSPLVVISGLKPSQEAGALGELGDYTIREVIGYGGMGTVLKAWDKRLSRVVAIKVLHPHLAMSGAARVRFAREAQLVASISHPNVVPIHDVADDHSQPYIVMGFVSGGSLQDRLDQDGPLSLEESLRIGLQIAEGLEAAHSHGLVHRDIKPANILLEARWQRVLITDFGLARALDDSSITASGQLAGTPQYMSPEQSRGDRIDHRSDLFSLGSVLYTMLSGRPPFRGESAVAIMQKVSREQPKPVHEVQDHLPYWTQQLIQRLHAKSPGDRIHTAVEAISLIRCCLQHVQNPSSGPLPRGFYATPRNASRSWLQAAMILLTILLSGYAIANRLRQVDAPRTEAATSGRMAEGINALNSDAAINLNPTEGSSFAASSANDAASIEAVIDWNSSIDGQLDLLWNEIFEAGFENR